MTEKSKKKKSKAARWGCGAIMFIIIVLSCGVYIGCQALEQWDGDEPVRVDIPAGASAQAVRDSLATHLGDYGSKVYRLWQWQKGKPAVAHGSYVAQPGMTALQLSRRLLQGRQTPVRVTFNNVRTMTQLAERVAAYMEFGPTDFLSACDSVLPQQGYARLEYISGFMPDTYEFYWTATAPSVVEKLEKAHGSFWTPERLSQAQALGMSPAQVATIASIAEEETVKTDELPRVARLYLNRLNKGMLLQADPTVKFAVGDFSLRRIGKAHLSVESPYNTYRHAGLPPGPIRLASQRAIDAVLTAPQHPYLYMCARDDFSGYHNFATDLKTHQENARKYQAELNRRGIK